jgi:hypothetical protein
MKEEKKKRKGRHDREEEGVEEARDIGNEVRTEGDEENGRE